MDTDNQPVALPGSVPLSTTLTTGPAPQPSGGGVVTEPTPDAKPETAGDTLRAELAKVREQEAKDAEKVKGQGEDAAKDAKAKLEEAEKDKVKPKDDAPKLDKDGKPLEADKPKDKEPADDADKSAADKPATEREGDKSRQSEGAKRNDPPARFLPKAKEAWINVPHSVRDDVYRMEAEHEAEKTELRKSTERYESIREFDEIAQKNGRQLRDSLTKVVQVEQALARNPIAGLDMILREIGPRKPDGSPLSLYDVAQHIARQSPQEFSQTQQQMRQQEQLQQREQQQTGEVQQLRTELQTLQAERLAEKIIEPFKADHPRYQELQEDIAFFLKSGKIPASLSPVERLEAAYDMAERINPASKSDALQTTDAPVAAKPAPADDAGAKSIRGAPSGGSDPGDDEGDVTDIRKLLEREKRKLAS